MVVDILAGSLATLVTAPLLVWFIIYGSMKKLTHKKKKSFHFASDITTFFLIASVLSIAHTIWNHSLLWPIMVLLLLIFSCITWLYWKQDKDIELIKIIKTAWRFNFLLFFMCYLLLCAYGLITRIISV
ncbi:DUF3397 domain-containing protein [Pseudalkalibacillus decolorationis]|uniref:DUF3397 domain-containing protein n=1 Tax=Pseudalkalibacillus decolorationis TaxID=163879 RepID=UPI00214805B7|nr:DUF3397 domain-containing protein [Pseudalkalibacillus decolorationis]